MRAILDQLYQDLDREAVPSLADRFSLSLADADRALRLTAPAVLGALKDRLNAPGLHAGLLSDVIAHIAEERPRTVGQNPPDLGHRLLDAEYENLIDALVREIGISPDDAETTAETLVPLILRCLGAPHRDSGDMLSALSARLGASGSGLRDIINDLWPPPES